MVASFAKSGTFAAPLPAFILFAIFSVPLADVVVCELLMELVCCHNITPSFILHEDRQNT